MNRIKEVLRGFTQQNAITRYSNFNSGSTKVKLAQLSVSSTIKLEVLNAAGFSQTVYMDYSTFADLKNALDDWFKTEEAAQQLIEEALDIVIFSLGNALNELTEEYDSSTPEELIEDGEIQREDTVNKDESSMPN